jgi:hypothetical protein
MCNNSIRIHEYHQQNFVAILVSATGRHSYNPIELFPLLLIENIVI